MDDPGMALWEWAAVVVIVAYLGAIVYAMVWGW